MEYDIVASRTPMLRCATRPFSLSCGTTLWFVSTGTAKPIPADEPLGEKIAVFMPIRSRDESTSGPPELPGLIAASV